MDLRVTAARVCRCPDELVGLAGWRVVANSFSAVAIGEPDYTLARSIEGSFLPMEGPSVPAGSRYRVDGRAVVVDIPQHSFAAEASLRLMWSLATSNDGGILLHAAGIAVGDRAAIVTGVSGAGKSTLARHAASAGAEVLSDEIVQVFPDGTIRGTPFRSEPDIGCSSRVAKLEWILTPKKTDIEQVLPWPTSDALRLVAEQTYHEEAVAPPRQEIRHRQMEIVNRARLGQFACRNHLDAGRFLVRLLSDSVS